MEKNIVILAPHVDDEMIGCWRLLNAKQVRHVFYFSEVDNVRIVEAAATAKAYDFTFGVIGQIPDVGAVLKQITKQLQVDDVVMVPNCRDTHPAHKWVNNAIGKALERDALALGINVRYYSVDMNVRYDVLGSENAAKKHQALLTAYPSQAALFSDAKYYLFESFLVSDTDTTIEVTFQFEGIHAYPDAPEGVEFLRYPHRHVFHVAVELQVWHDDRDVEFILFKRELQEQFGKGGNLDGKSCEMIARIILSYVTTKYRDRNCKVKVSEDGENAATVEYKLWS